MYNLTLLKSTVAITALMLYRIKKNMKKLIQTTKKIINTLLANSTLAKLASAFVTVITVALIKYMVSGNFYIEYCEFWNNVAIGLLG